MAVLDHPLTFDEISKALPHIPVREHSRKPGEARTGLERLFGDVRRIEMFARETAPGWDAWGDQVGKFGAAS